MHSSICGASMKQLSFIEETFIKSTNYVLQKPWMCDILVCMGSEASRTDYIAHLHMGKAQMCAQRLSSWSWWESLNAYNTLVRCTGGGGDQQSQS